MGSDTVKNSEKILNICSYRPHGFESAVIQPCPEKTRVVQETLQAPFKNPPVSGLGNLDRLPPELMLMVLYCLDLHSYFKFRQVNRSARVLSTSLREYKLVSKYALESLRNLFRTRLGHAFTIVDLHRTLISPGCKLCGGFGGFVFLFTLVRCCPACIQNSPKLRVIHMSALAKLARRSPNRLSRLLEVILWPVPGLYSMSGGPAIRPKRLLAEEQTVATLKSLGLLSHDSIEAIARHNGYKNQRFMAVTVLPWYDMDNAKIERGVSCKGCRFYPGFLRYPTQKDREDQDRIFSTRDFLSHFNHCAKARKIWTKFLYEVDSSPFIYRGRRMKKHRLLSGARKE
ncbi:hypothetical protein Daesc_006363 [Daldinia eschscholtzii]|uniref:F-box domain-containing protein n=1 Tax=Daldinia eschscholtzii TaxID=292717 RepID=A0AAX6MGK9_9PEZI